MSADITGMPPIVGVTTNYEDGQYRLRPGYLDMISCVGGVPIMLGQHVEAIDDYLNLCDALVMSGGDDPRTEQFGEPTHPKVTPIDPQRQTFETALLNALDQRPELPVLGVCLGMQMMALHAGGKLDQYLPESTPTADLHWGHTPHKISGDLPGGVSGGEVFSHHRQAVKHPGKLSVIATAPDGIIEAVRDEKRPFYFGVQWHPERTPNEKLGVELFRLLVKAIRKSARVREATIAEPKVNSKSQPV